MRVRGALVCFLATLLMSPLAIFPATRESIFDQIRREHQEIEKSGRRVHVPAPQGEADLVGQAQASMLQPFDVGHYRLQIRLDPVRSAFSGVVTITGQTTASVSALAINAEDNLVIDAVRLDGVPAQFNRSAGQLTVALPAPAAQAVTLNLGVEYHSLAVTSGRLGGGMLVRLHGPDPFVVMANLSEPFAGPTWWPCIDDPRDKASVEVEATAPDGYQVASNGLLAGVVPNSDNTITWFWRSNYPVATYLVSVALTNYVKFEDTYVGLDGITRMPLVYYVYPEHLDQAQSRFGVTRRAIEIFAALFGEYPFIDEKYGMAEFPWGGAMEHQTMTSVGQNIIGSTTNTGETVIVHELAHQWWGDLVTMKTWDDIWLNEGFATYCEALYYEASRQLDIGQLMSLSYDDGEVWGRLGGTVTAEHADDPFDDQGAIYTKGAWLLHMIRHIVGDQMFFDALRDYRAGHAFGNASTSDLQQAFESRYGKPLDWFFQQWIYAPGRPFYKKSSKISGPDASGNYTVKVTVKQKQNIDIPGRSKQVFIMPIDLTIHYADGTSETRPIFNDSRKQKFVLSASKQPVSVGLDERHWVLKKLK